MVEETQKKKKTTSKKSLPTQTPKAGPSRLPEENPAETKSDIGSENEVDDNEEEDSGEGYDDDGFVEGMDPGGFVGESKLKPLTPEALAAFKASQDRAGIIYISRIPPGMRPPKVRHLMSNYGAVGRVYLQQEDPKRAYLRRKFTSTKKAHYTEGWVEFKDKKVARSVAEMLNAQPIGGKKGTRWRDDIWTMKYLPKFKWYMLTEQVAHETAVHAAKLRVELSQSKNEQQQYLKNVVLAHVLDKRAAKKKEKGEEFELKPNNQSSKKRTHEGDDEEHRKKKQRDNHADAKKASAVPLDSVLKSIF